MASDWSPAQYLKFEDHRTRPALDLLSAIRITDADSVTDLGCGPGNSTELLVHRYPEAFVTGLDSSPAMIAAARKRLPQVQFQTDDITTWAPERPQRLVFANAVLQWLSGHAELLPRLISFLLPGGVLAIQMPDNLNEPTHASMRVAAADPRWFVRMSGADHERTTILSAQDYYEILKPCCHRVDIWRTIYYHPIDGHSGIVEWFKSTGLKPYLDRLPPEEADEYITLYQALLRDRYPLQKDGTVLLPFPRLFIIAET